VNRATIYNEDWARRTWDIRTPAGTPVSDLAGLAAAYRMGEEDAARALLASPAFVVAPPALRDEVQRVTSTDEWFDPNPNPQPPTPAAEEAPPMSTDESKGKPNPFAKGGGDTPPEITTGSFVSWSGGKGRVDLVVTNGKVPGVEGDVEGSTKTPAARVVVWENGKPTRKKIGKSTHTLKRIAPIKSEKAAASAASALVERLADHEEAVERKGLPRTARVSGRALKRAYDRGVKAWPGADATTLSPDEWALGRVEHFIKVAEGAVADPAHAGNDVDLLPAGHPMSTAPAPVRQQPADDGPLDLFADTEQRGAEAQRLAGMAQEALTGSQPQEPTEDDGEGGERVVLTQEEIDAQIAALGLPEPDED
jgi:hypothetical protein